MVKWNGNEEQWNKMQEIDDVYSTKEFIEIITEGLQQHLNQESTIKYDNEILEAYEEIEKLDIYKSLQAISNKVEHLLAEKSSCKKSYFNDKKDKIKEEIKSLNLEALCIYNNALDDNNHFRYIKKSNFANILLRQVKMIKTQDIKKVYFSHNIILAKLLLIKDITEYTFEQLLDKVK